MNEREIKFGYLNNFPRKIVEFNSCLLGNDDSFVQIYFEGESYLRVGDLYHRTLLGLSLEGFGVGFETKTNFNHKIIPIEKDLGKDYEMVGAGKIKKSENGLLQFYKLSFDYAETLFGTNKKHLEDIFGKENVFLDEESTSKTVSKTLVFNVGSELE